MPNELTPYEQWQLEQYGDILEKRYQDEEVENGFVARERDDRWTEEQTNFSLTEQEF